ncbi:MAG: AzlD domain-containing protein [Prevotella sp.]|jgi:branched-subunit amino acid transport protein|nr:AzlD domain-containing protein [Prevotella sp.]MBR0270016.1 AzlD domain-containing protein [Prevotella sp.]MBR0525940.1 AzlD domain-containing protein [Prevotella sp.]
MDKQSIIVCILLAIITTNLIRVVPMLLIKGQISNRFLRSFLYYVPYVTLAVMTFPSMVQATVSPVSGAVALITGIVAAWRGLGLFPVAAICCAIVYLMDNLIL